MKKNIFLFLVGLILVCFTNNLSAQKNKVDTRVKITKINDSLIEYQLFTSKNQKRLTLKCYYTNGKIDSTCTAFYKNGNIKYNEKWNKNHLIERTNIFDIKGNSLHPGKLIEGTGIVYGYYKKGEMAYEYSYMNGLRNGDSKYYSKDGLILFTEKFENDKLILKTEYNGTSITYETPFMNGKKNGVGKVYDKNGKVIYLLVFENDICVKKNFK
jgi:antitoxin component YwqK of YwqJK toxin-antitoxin module